MIRMILWVLLCMLPLCMNAQNSSENSLKGFTYVGDYKLESSTKIEGQELIQLMISPLIYKVYTNGLDIRVYVANGDKDSYIAYTIYNADSIGEMNSEGGIDFFAGVQAYSTQGEMIRQLSVTRSSLTMVKIPPRSHRVLVTKATLIK